MSVGVCVDVCREGHHVFGLDVAVDYVGVGEKGESLEHVGHEHGVTHTHGGGAKGRRERAYMMDLSSRSSTLLPLFLC